MRKGLPDLSPDLIEELTEKDIDKFDLVPCVSVLLRLCRESDRVESPMAYEYRSYRSDKCKPNEAEVNLFRLYFKEKEFHSSTVRNN